MSLYKHKYKTAEGTKLSDHWYYRFNRDGKTYTGSTGTSNKTSAAKFEDAKKNEANEAKHKVKTKTLTINEALAKYCDAMAHSGQHVNILGRARKLQGMSKDKRTLKPIKVFGFDGQRDFGSLTMADLQSLVIARRSEGAANATILTELSTFSQTVKMIKKLGFEVPTIDFSELKKDNSVRPAKSRVRWLNAAEEKGFLKQLHPDTPIHGGYGLKNQAARQDGHDLAVMYLNLGPRYNEFASLKWEHVDLDKRVIYLYRTKTDNESTLDMPAVVYEVLARRFKSKRNDQVYLFEDSKCEVHRKYAPGVFRAAYRRAGIRGASVHTMRHTYAAKFIQNGGTLYELQQQLGHSSSSTTQIYAHLAPNQGSARSVAIMDRLNT